MKILVTGATGRIGTRLTEALLREGHTVRALVLADDPRAAHVKQMGAEIAEGNLEDRTALATAVNGIEAVYHLGAALESLVSTDEEMFETNLRGTYNLLSVVRDWAPDLRRFVFASSDAVYWEGPAEPACYLPVDESHPRRPGGMYGLSKLAGEELCLTFSRSYRIPCSIARFSITANADELIDPEGLFGGRWFLSSAIRSYGSAARSRDEDAILEALREADDGSEKIFIEAGADGNVPNIDINDARNTAQGLLTMLTATEAIGECFNLGPPAPHSQREFLSYLADRLKLPWVVIRVPAARPSWYLSSAKARGLLGYLPVNTAFDMVDEAVGRRQTRDRGGA